MADILSQTASQVLSTAKPSGLGSVFSSGMLIFILFFVGLGIISVVGAFLWFHFSEKKKWNIITRVHYENPTIDGVNIGGPVPTKRIRFKDGRVVYMYKTAIQGYTISPELLTWSRPREHDIVVTQDKKLFSVVGINSIDTQRKKLNVDISYPDIEMDRQDLQKHIDSKKFDDPNERLKIIAKVALWIFICITLIVVTVLAGKSYVEGKNADAARDLNNLKAAEMQVKTAEQMNTFILILSKVMPESFKAIDGQNLLNQTLSVQ